MPTPIDDQATGDAQTALDRPPVATYQPGVVLAGKYRLEALLGEGGMGAVWRASNLLLDLPVAIKLIRADLDRGALRARLQLEARSAAKLGHPAIVRVYDVGESEFGDPFIVMEHLRGETLAQLLCAGRLSATRAVQLLLPIIDALAMAHARGIVHRDLKPDNLMIAREDQHVCPKILDFGVAKLTDPRDLDAKLTEAGVVVGSPEYMSPEQARGQDDVDASTDVWSMCIVLYEALTGSTPFAASNYNALLRSIVEDDPQPLSEHAAGDEELWQILARGLHKDRAQRYAKISQLGEALAGWLLSQGVTEDACGSSIDSKWFGHRSDSLSAGKAAPVLSASSHSQTKPSHESIPDSMGLAGGPFTATIRPVNVARTWTLSAALVGCALLGLSALALGHARLTTGPTARGPAAGTAMPATASFSRPASSPLPPPAAIPLQTSPTPIEVWPAGSAHPEAKAEIKTPSAPRQIKPAVNAVRAKAPAAVPAASPSTPLTPPKPNRPLDLLAPY
ncbi:MAG TPA: serine/threonine-protein kinase [Polyangiaceae bacterium]|nr:serine/threonine-protein kinase [Polyangiaceae bacterium]